MSLFGNYIGDGINPRGSEYGATARAARAAQQTQQAMDDMLMLAMASDDNERRVVAQRIQQRKQREARTGHTMQICLLLLLVSFFVIVWQLGDDRSALSGAVRALIAAPSSSSIDDAPAPTGSVRAPDDTDSDVVVQRGLTVLRASGLSNEQIEKPAGR